jgi:hypothetical protein
VKTLLSLVLAVTFLGLGMQAADARARKKRPKPAAAQPAVVSEEDVPAAGGKKRAKVIDFTGLGIEGSLRTPQLLYFLQRVKTELDRASLEARSFMPELNRSLGEEGL